jgi:hypothetical protein
MRGTFDLLDELRGRLEKINQAIFSLELLQLVQALSRAQLQPTTELSDKTGPVSSATPGVIVDP